MESLDAILEGQEVELRQVRLGHLGALLLCSEAPKELCIL